MNEKSPDPAQALLALHVRFQSDLLWITRARCRPASAQTLPERQLVSHTIVFPRRGIFLKHREGKVAVGDPNHVLFFSPGEVYRASHPGGMGDDCDVLTFSPSVVRDALDSLDERSRDRQDTPFAFDGCEVTPESTIDLNGLMARVSPMAPPPDPQAVQEHAIHLLARVLQQAYASRGHRVIEPTKRSDGQKVLAVMSLLATRYAEALSLATLADAVELSPFYLCRLFKRHTGLTIHRYLTRLRLRAAVDRLTDGDTKLAALSLELGFSSHSHFSEAFKREFGMTPSTIRTRLINGRAPHVRRLPMTAKVQWRTLADLEAAPEPFATASVANGTGSHHAEHQPGRLPMLLPCPREAMRGSNVPPEHARPAAGMHRVRLARQPCCEA